MTQGKPVAEVWNPDDAPHRLLVLERRGRLESKHGDPHRAGYELLHPRTAGLLDLGPLKGETAQVAHRRRLAEHFRVADLPILENYEEYQEPTAEFAHGDWSEVIDDWTGTFDDAQMIRRQAALLVGDMTEAADPRLGKRDFFFHEGSGLDENRAMQTAIHLLRGIRDDDPPGEFPLYRGVTASNDRRERFLAEVKAGQTLSLPLMATTDSRKATETFGDDITFVIRGRIRAVVGLQMQEPTYQSWDEIPSELRSENYSPDGNAYRPGSLISEEHDSEAFYSWSDDDKGPHEYITGGQFRVRQVMETTRIAASGNRKITVVLEQIGVYDPDTGELVTP